VRPVEITVVDISGPGSVNRTRFLGFMGVVAAGIGSSMFSSVFCAMGTGSWIARPVLIRLFRRTAMGLSSEMSMISEGLVLSAIARRLLIIEISNVYGAKERKKRIWM
jgi:hypothetical protein